MAKTVCHASKQYISRSTIPDGISKMTSDTQPSNTRKDQAERHRSKQHQ
jgi:hypothetical protein